MTPATLRFSALFLISLAFGSLSVAALARADSGMEWQFFQTDDPGNKSTRLVYGVPETDNVQVSGACVHSSSVGANFSIVTFGADIGDLQNDKDTELRMSGGGFDHALKGKIFRATGEEGVSGVQVDIGNDDPLWRAFAEKDSLDYLVPGYKASSLDLTKGRDKIQQFVKACETFDNASPPAEGAAASEGGDVEKDAFESAKELGTVEAWQAFITNYPSGFRADLARAYIKNLGSSQPAKRPVAKKITGCEEGFKLVKGKCKRITANQPSQGCPAGTKPVPETDNCVPITSGSKSSCSKVQIKVDGKCMTKNQAVGFCGPGFHAQGGKCLPGFVLPQGPRPSTHGCPPGMAWSKEEGCHEDD
jgi:hypothetical protein